MITTTRTPAERTGLLARAQAESLIALADSCLEGAAEPVVTQPPETGLVMLTVREPVETTRFHLGEVLVTRCAVRHRGVDGWAMRMGSDPAATLAAAVLDAEVESDGPLASAVIELCDLTQHQLTLADAREWQDIEPTIVDFEEMD